MIRTLQTLSEEHSYVVLMASLLIALGGWGATFNTWAEATRVGNVFGLLGIVGGVLLAWVGKSPIGQQEK